MRSVRYSLVVLIATLALATSMPGHAADNVDMSFRTSSGFYPATRFTPLSSPACQLSAPAGSNGIAVLDAAVSKGCIKSYELTTFSNGHYVRCIDGRCEAIGFYWAMYVDGTLTCYGIDDFQASSGRELAFSYESWATAFGAVCL